VGKQHARTDRRQAAFKINLLSVATLLQQQSRRPERMDGVSWLSGTCVPFQKHCGVTSKVSCKGNSIEGSVRKDFKLNREISQCIHYWESSSGNSNAIINRETKHRQQTFISHIFNLFTKAQLLLLWLQEWHTTLIPSRQQKGSNQKWAWSVLP